MLIPVLFGLFIKLCLSPLNPLVDLAAGMRLSMRTLSAGSIMQSLSPTWVVNDENLLRRLVVFLLMKLLAGSEVKRSSTPSGSTFLTTQTSASNVSFTCAQYRSMLGELSTRNTCELD